MSYTGVSFNGTHSYDDWGLRLKGVEISIPQAKTEYVDVPGMDGSLDLTEAQNGGVRYEMRTLTFTFNARHCSYLRWTAIISQIANAIEGKECKIIIDFDSGYYYTGRCHIDTTKTNMVTSEIVITATCDPYKIDVNSSDEPWIWDTFSFVDGVITSTADIVISSASGWQEVELQGHPYNETIVIVSTAAMTVKFNGTEYSISAGANTMYDIELEDGTNYLYFQGSGTVTIVARGGRL